MPDTPPQTPSTPQNIRHTKDLPPIADDDDEELPPLELPSAGGLGFPDYTDTDLSDLTPAQIYEMNQQLLNESVPPRPLIDDVAPMSNLRAEYENGAPSFLAQIDWLTSQGYDHVQRTRGDGDCFYRSLGFAYIDSLIHSPEREFAVASSLSVFESTKETLDRAGIEKLVYEDFYDYLTSLIESVSKPGPDGGTLDNRGLLEVFQTPEYSNAAVIYLRFLTSAQIRLNREAYEGFLVHPDTRDIMDVESYCANVVQAMGKEADNVEIEALCRALQLNVDLAYLTGVKGDGVDFIKFRNDPNPAAPPLTLLYRPGHYDILIKAPVKG